MSRRAMALAASASAVALGLLAAGVSVGAAQAQSSDDTTRGRGARAGIAVGVAQHERAGVALRQRGGPGAGTWTSSGPTSSVATLTVQQRADLLAMVEEEKLAGDVYEVLAARYDDATLTRIAAAEDRHAAAVRRLLATYGIDDPTADLGVGEFATEAFQQLYDDLVDQGAASLEAAYAVGARIERLDIADLTEAIATAQGRTDIVLVYTHLRTGSTHHLAAFTA